MEFIKGNFKRYIFRSDKGFTVGLFKVRDSSVLEYKNKTVTFTGYFSDLNETDLYVLNGSFIEHERYGMQFQTESYEVVLPLEKDNIIEFLSSSLFKGISIEKASKIVEYLGENCLNLILENKDVLNNVPRLTIKQKDVIYNALVKYQNSFEIMIELTKLGFNSKDALTINNFYKEKTLDIVKENPYIITNDIKEITFKKIDKLKHNFGIKDDDFNRVKAGIKYVFNEVNNSLGNTYLVKEEVINYSKRALGIIDEDLIIECLNRLILETEVILYDEKYFIRKMFEAENYIADRLCNLSDYHHVEMDEKVFENLEKHFSIEFNNDQKRAIISSLLHDFLVITGGPGTGKTTIIKAICKLYQDLNNFNEKELLENLALLAPTGRASKRISEQTNLPSKTIHRFLKWDKESNTFSINEDNPSDVNLVIIDESSMIDTYLFYNLLLGLKPSTKIIMIGDYNQLPSVGAGQVLKDILDSDVVPFIKLEKLYRQKENSNITLLAHSISNNEIDYSLFNKEEDLTFIETTSSNLKEYLKEFALTYKDLDFNKFQVLAPIYKGDNGIDNLNYFMQEVINDKETNKFLHEGVNYKENDKVLQLVNEPDLNIFNGDIGRIIKINNNKTKEMYIDFDNNIVRYTSSMVSNIKLGYTISIHKAQGSEFDVVIIPITSAYSNMLYKKLIYTAVTRAKKKLILIGEFSAFKKAVLNNREETRKTYLKNFLKLCIENRI